MPQAEFPSSRPAQVRHVQTGHVANLGRAEFSQDGRYLLTVSTDGEAIVWDARDGRQLHTPGLIDAFPPAGYRRIVDLSPDGSQILVGVPASKSNRVQLALRSVVSGGTLHTLDYSDDAFPEVGAFSSDGQYVCTISDRNRGVRFHVWDAKTGVCVWSPDRKLPYDVDYLEAIKDEIKSGKQRFDFTVGGNVSYLLFLRHVRPDGRPLTFNRPLRMYNWTEGVFGPGGRCFVTREASDVDFDEATLWNVDSCRPIKRFRNAHDEQNTHTFHPNGRSLIVGARTKGARLVDAKTGEVIQTFEGHEEDITCLAFAPDGSSILTGDKHGVVIMWDVATARPIRVWPRHSGGVFSVAYHPDGQRVLFGCGDGMAIEYRADTGQQRMSLSLRQGARRTRGVTAQYSPEGRRILTRTIHDWHHPDWSAVLWNAKTGLQVCTIGASPQGRLELSPNGKWAVRQSKAPLHLWSTETGRRVHSFHARMCRPKSRPAVYSGEASATPPQSSKGVGVWGRRMAQPTSSSLWLTSEVKETFDTIPGIDREAKQWLNSWVEELAAKPQEEVRSGFHLFAKAHDGALRPAAWGTYSGPRRLIARLDQGELACKYDAEPLMPTAATLTQDGSRLLVAYCETGNSKEKGRKTLIVWDTKTGKRLKTIDVTQAELAPSWDVRLLTLSPDDRHLAMGYEYRIVLFNMTTEQSLLVGPSGPYSVTKPLVLFSPDSRRVFCYGRRRTLWDIQRKVQLVDLGAYNGVERPLFSPNGKYLFAVSSDYSRDVVGAIIWDCETGQVLHKLGSQAVVLTFSRSGDRMVAFRGDMKNAELWDFNNGRKLRELIGPAGESVREALYTPDGDRLITTHNHALAVWDITSGEMLNSHIDETYPFDYYNNMQSPFLLDGTKRLISVHRNGAVVWDVASGEPIHKLRAPYAPRTSVLLGHEPNTLLTVSPGKKTILWDLESGQQRVTYEGMPSDITAGDTQIRFSDDGRRIFARYRRGQAMIAWNAETGQVDKRFWLLNGGQDLLVETAQAGRFLGSPNAMKKVVVTDQ